MRLADVQANLQTVVKTCATFAALQSRVLIDDGAIEENLEKFLREDGIVVAILPPQGSRVNDQAKGIVLIEYGCTVWLRTNPKVKTAGAARFNPLAVEAEIIAAVLSWSRARANQDRGFRIPPDNEPETDFTDVGMNSRLIRFATDVQFS